MPFLVSLGADTSIVKTATIITTASSTYVAGDAGTYRVCCVGAGGHKNATSHGGGSGFIVYAEVDLTASQNVSVTVGAGVGTGGTYGNRSIFGTEPGTIVLALGGFHGEALGTIGGFGFSGGGSTGSGGGSDGSNGSAGNAGYGQGSGILDLLAEKFSDVTFAAAAANNDSGGGITVNGTEYGSAVDTGTSFNGVVIVAGPY